MVMSRMKTMSAVLGYVVRFTLERWPRTKGHCRVERALGCDEDDGWHFLCTPRQESCSNKASSQADIVNRSLSL